mgnify:CR=1 FL=1
MSMFEKYIVKLNEKPEPEQPLNLSMNIYENPMISKEALRERLYNFQKYNDQEIYVTILGSITMILTEIFTNINDEKQEYLKLITNKRFLTIFIRAVDSYGSKLTYDEKIRCNKLAYEYLINEDNDPDIRSLFFSLSKVVNRESVSLLTSIGIPEKLADYFALARYSSQKEVVNVKRLNFLLMNSDPKLIDLQMIIYIYEKLFDHVLPLFEGIMTDSIDDDADYMTDDMWLIYSNISLAILEIINNMPSEMIIAILRAYSETYYKLYGNVKPRFNINGISDDYIRILRCLEMLRVQENIVF